MISAEFCVFPTPLLHNKVYLPCFMGKYKNMKTLKNNKINILSTLGVASGLLGLALALNLSCPAVAWGCSCSKSSSVKANMHTLQTMVETYAVDWKGVYPPTLAALITEAQQTSERGAYWKEFTNPYTRQTGVGKSLTAVPLNKFYQVKRQLQKRELPHTDLLGLRFYHAQAQAELPPLAPLTLEPGMAVYIPVNQNQYFIYGTDKHAEWLSSKGEYFVLSNG